MAGIAAVVPQPDGGEAVFYSGLVADPPEMDGRVVFVDGTTFAVESGLEIPSPGSTVLVQIDPVAHAVVAFTSAAAADDPSQ
jgi:hypothetical protein